MKFSLSKLSTVIPFIKKNSLIYRCLQIFFHYLNIYIYIFKFNCKTVLAKSSNVMGLRIFDILIYFTKNQTDFYTQSFYYCLQILKKEYNYKKD